MYVRNLHISNNGPIERLSLEFPLAGDGRPKPVVLVGGNGSGKTNLLSTIADALFEAAAQHYQNALQGQSPTQRPWFRVVGGKTIRQGSAGSATVISFTHDDKTFAYIEKGGTISAADFQSQSPECLKSLANWKTDGEPVKRITIEPVVSQGIFESGVYVFFPASRAETPHWFNREAVPVALFESVPQITGVLRKPIFVEQGLARFEQWLAAAIFDSRSDIAISNNGFKIVGNVAHSLGSRTALSLANTVLQHIFGNPDLRFAWQGRYASEKIGIYDGNNVVTNSLDGLSSGQSALLAVFGTIIRYGDTPSPNGTLAAPSIAGVCVVDEIDAHMHVDLQHRAIPQLVKMFPAVQFIVSAHSPLLVLGMEKYFGVDGFSLIEMPSGNAIRAEAYREFENAFRALQDTRTFDDAVSRAASRHDKAIVFLEGEADQEYFATAVDLLGYQNLLEGVEFVWIGSIDQKSKNNIGSGKGGLTAAYNFLKSNPQITKRPIVFLYDVDVAKPDLDEPPLHIRTLPRNPKARSARGVENMFDADFIPEEIYFNDPIASTRDDGGSSIVTSPNKIAIRQYLCKTHRNAEYFVHFKSVLEGIGKVVGGGSA